MATRNAERSAARCAASDKTARDPAKIIDAKRREWLGWACVELAGKNRLRFERILT
jgi:hypothetical protein